MISKIFIVAIVIGLILTLFTSVYSVPQSCQGKTPCLLWDEVEYGFPFSWYTTNSPFQTVSVIGFMIDFSIWIVVASITLFFIIRIKRLIKSKK